MNALYWELQGLPPVPANLCATVRAVLDCLKGAINRELAEFVLDSGEVLLDVAAVAARA